LEINRGIIPSRHGRDAIPGTGKPMAVQQFRYLRRAKVKTMTAKDLMVPLDEYATVPEGATLWEAIMALEKAQEAVDFKKGCDGLPLTVVRS
jgi:hypothetical protein